MAVTHPTATRTAIAQAVADIANLGGTPVLVIGTSALSGATGVLAVISIPDFTVSNGVATSAADTNSATASAGGTAAKCEVRAINSAGTTAFLGAVGTSGAEVNISSTTITSGDTVTLTSDVVYTAPA